MTTAPRDARWNRLSLTIMAAGITALLAAGLLFALAFMGIVGDENGNSTIDTGVAFHLEPTVAPTPTSLPPPSEAPIARIKIPRFEVDAPIQIRGVDGNRVMETPDGPENVAWYDFSARPGFGSNAVFSGHVDYINYGPAVFYNIGNLSPGDTIEVALEDGTVYTYSVFEQYQVTADPTEEELRKIVSATPNEVVTLITCGGTFNSSTAEYDHRTIVRASRVFATDAPTAAGAVPTSAPVQ
ncbi:MAG: class F sortase [Dehalococcoidia bacterium]